MESDSFIHKELLRTYPDYRIINDPDLQLEFFNALPTTAQRALKAAAVRSKGVGPNRMLINDPEIDTKALCAPAEANGSPEAANQPTLATLISIYVDYYPIDQKNDEPVDSSLTVLDTQIILAYRSWWKDIARSPHVSLCGKTMEVVGFLSTDCLDDDLCVFEVVDLYYLLLRRGESHAKHLFKTRFPLTHEVQVPETYSTNESSGEPVQALLSNIPLSSDPDIMKHVDTGRVLDQFIQLRKKLRLWLLTRLHNYVLEVLNEHCTASIGNTNISMHIPDIVILNEPLLPQEPLDEEMHGSEENKNRLIVLKNRESATKMLLCTPCISAFQDNQENNAIEALRSLQDRIVLYTSTEFDMLCEDSIPLFPRGWA